MSELLTQAFLKGLDSDQKHRDTIEKHLAGEKVEPNQLWLSVGYFYHGAGRFSKRSFVTETQWKQLLRETGRERDAEET